MCFLLVGMVANHGLTCGLARGCHMAAQEATKILFIVRAEAARVEPMTTQHNNIANYQYTMTEVHNYIWLCVIFKYMLVCCLGNGLACVGASPCIHHRT